METTTKPFKSEVKIEKWGDGMDHTVDPPDEVLTVATWYEDGEKVTDADRISELEAGIEST